MNTAVPISVRKPHAGRRFVTVGHRVGGEVPAGVEIGPRPASRKSLRIGYGLVEAVAAVVVGDVAVQPVVERGLRYAFVVAAPDGDRRDGCAAA